MKTLLPFLLFGLLAVPAKAAEPEDQLPPVPEGTDEAKAIMAKMDADGDAKVARAEFVGQSGLPEDLSKAVFNEFDMDGNGSWLTAFGGSAFGRAS